MSGRTPERLERLVYAALEDGISESEFAELDQWLSEDRQALEYYLDFVELYTCLYSQNGYVAETVRSKVNEKALGSSMAPGARHAQYFQDIIEKDLEEKERKEAAQQESRQKRTWLEGIRVRRRRRLRVQGYGGRPEGGTDWVRNGKLARILVRVAAVIMVAVGVMQLDQYLTGRRAGENYYAVELRKQLDCVWDMEPEKVPKVGGRYRNGLFQLKEGFAQFRFSDGAEMLVEGPALLDIRSKERLTLNKGKVYIEVSKRAKGLTVEVPGCDVVDLGTEFAVEVNSLGDSFVQVYKGLVRLERQQAGGSKAGEVLVSARQARLVEDRGRRISPALYVERKFARRLSMDDHAVWRGTSVLKVYANKLQHRVTPRLMGASLEDLNYQCYGGLYSQLLHGEGFEEQIDVGFLGLDEPDRDKVFVTIDTGGRSELWYWGGYGFGRFNQSRKVGNLTFPANGQIEHIDLPPDIGRRLQKLINGPEQISRYWRKVQRGSAQGRFTLERYGELSGEQCQRIRFEQGEGELGIDNAGFFRRGIKLEGGRRYEGMLQVKNDGSKPITVWISLNSQDGLRRYAEKGILVKPGGDRYQRVEFELTPDQSDAAGRFALSLKEHGSIVVDYALLQPGAWGRYQGLPVRADLAQALIDEGIKLLSFNGGIIRNNAGGENYNWKMMRKPRDLREPITGWFTPYASQGFGLFELMDFCKAAGMEAVAGVPMPNDAVNIASLVEYANGDAKQSYWGRERAKDGHPEPYGLRYLELGQMNKLDNDYVNRFIELGSAVWDKDPEIVLVVSCDLSKIPEKRLKLRSDGTMSQELQAATRLVQFARGRRGTIWWNSALNAEGQSDEEAQMLRQSGVMLKQTLAELVDDYDLKLAPLWEHGSGHELGGALVHARYLNIMARNGEDFAAAAAASPFQNAANTVSAWQDGRTFFEGDRLWHQPAYYVDQMISRRWADRVVVSSLDSEQAGLDVIARKTADNQELQLHVVNTGDQAIHTRIELEGFHSRPQVRYEYLTGQPDQANSKDNPERIRPTTQQKMISDDRFNTMDITFKPHSFTVVRFTSG